ncbi:MAG: hypothetical protein M1818_003623 [Claussenomyces sp. TS43310]|nr:MAG: hypothetical protein M1818_003623 [Claussenomyces sp. TS43310]
MPPRKATTNGKRRASPTPAAAPSNGVKRSRTSPPASSTDPLRQPHFSAREAEENGIVLREFYPHEMCNARAVAYNSDTIARPIEQLRAALDETVVARAQVGVGECVVHWYKCDLRMRDNTALHLAATKAREGGVPLVCLYVVSPQDFEAHLTSPARVDFILRSLEVLRGDLARLDIPLHVETVERRGQVEGRIVELLGEWGARHLFANKEYEVDELRREARLVRRCLGRGISMHVAHDTCVVAPGKLTSGSGKQYSVYSPWFRAWVAHIHGNLELLDLFDAPERNPSSARKRYATIFEGAIPTAPENKRLGDEEKARFRSLWPAGEDEAWQRLSKFADERIGAYQAHRNFPGEKATSCLSVHLASGTLSARSAVRTARDRNSTKKLDGGNPGITTWISEVAWRDFYKHVLAHWPYVCMNKPFKPEYTNISWEYNAEHLTAWREGRTGYPIVDAAMRQLRHTGYMHNRCRMIVASFLAKDLLLDWRLGERHFMEHLIDGDFASNNGGWGFSASTGVDPQPYFRIFNPLLQSERFDPDGHYIREWVPELAAVAGKAVHDPYERGEASAAESAGYPRRIVEHKGSRERALARYKEGLGRDTA